MPRYHALDTGIKLCVWDPHAAPKLKTQEDKDHSTPPSSISDAFSRINGSLLPKSKRKGEEKSGPAIGYVVDDLEEEYFEGHEGVDFVAPGMPFYLVGAGRELFAPREEETCNSFGGFTGAILTTTPSTTLAKNIDEPTNSSQLFDANTDLSSIGAEFFTPGEGSFTASKQAEDGGEYTQQPGKQILIWQHGDCTNLGRSTGQ
jgi:hypothetical protein